MAVKTDPDSSNSYKPTEPPDVETTLSVKIEHTSDFWPIFAAANEIILSLNFSEAAFTAKPPEKVTVEPAVNDASGVRSVSEGTTSIESYLVQRTSAAICSKTVVLPSPTSM